jgi:phosphoglycolate phosphatase-like HAD superfamily hydrolase
MTHYIFLDFDGVICDSIPECFVSSYRAYRELYLGEAITSVPLRDKKLFYAYRPFIRSGEDYTLIHDIVRRGVVVSSQEIFDREIERAGAAAMARYGELFYRAREAFLASDRQLWLDLNPLFPGIARVLAATVNNKNAYILSTKKPPFIREILLHYGIDWDVGRILFPADRTKKEVIESVMKGEGKALFIDDQLDNLLVASENKNIDGRLAVWGYVKEPWLRQKRIPLLEREALFQITSYSG